MKKVHLTNGYLKTSGVNNKHLLEMVQNFKQTYYCFLTDEAKSQMILRFFRKDIGDIIL